MTGSDRHWNTQISSSFLLCKIRGACLLYEYCFYRTAVSAISKAKLAIFVLEVSLVMSS